jgi:hypothetical protein
MTHINTTHMQKLVTTLLKLSKSILMLSIAGLMATTGWAYTPRPGDPDRAAICNAVRLAIANNYGGQLQSDALHGRQFVIGVIDISSDTAVFSARGENGAYAGRTIYANLRQNAQGWWVDQIRIR